MDRLVLRNEGGATLETHELEALELIDGCNYPVGHHFALHCSGTLNVRFDVPADG
ncbi:MAG: hypothetical protein OXI13_04630 [Gammaproteobacteria bacterium]|nr:hypothetical protein [Gammaproteobacteria bacterium]